MAMKQFNLKEYLENPSKKVVTRNGLPVKIHCTNFNGPASIIAEIKSGYSTSYSTSFFENGRYSKLAESPLDLFFDTVKHEGWTPVYRSFAGRISFGCAYSTKKEAEEASKGNEYYLTTTKVEWEE